MSRVPYDRLVGACADVGRELSSMRLSEDGEAYFPTNPVDFPAPTVTAITAAQDPSGSYPDESDWVMGYFHDRRSLDLFAREVVPAFR